jgi:hypothetical protein
MTSYCSKVARAVLGGSAVSFFETIDPTQFSATAILSFFAISGFRQTEHPDQNE